MDTHTLSICSGYGGIELGLRTVIPRTRVVCYVENEVAQSQILASRIKDGGLDDAPIWTDLRTFDATAWSGKVHLLTGGFPCQPHSVAGKKRGKDDPRELSGEVLRIADELGRPTLFLENVPGIRRFYWDNIRPRLQEMGYRTEEVLVTARETGAPHKRQRLFIMANAGYPELSGWFQAAKRFIHESLDQFASQSGVLENSISTGSRGWSEGLQQESGARRSASTAQVERSGSLLADGDGSRISTLGYGTEREEQKRAQEGEDRSFDEPTGQVEDMVDTISGGAQESHAGEQSGKQQRDCPSEEVADSNAERLQGDGHTGKETYDERSRHVPLYPPGPDDYEGWTHVLTDVPSLEPAFCRVAHGSTPWVDKQLRSIGNGVVPASAARAFLLLSRRFE